MNDSIIDEMTPDQLAMLVELQRVELKRLLSEQKRLNERVDSLLELQEREQVLRQQMQTSLDRLVDMRDGSRAPGVGASNDIPMLTDRLDRAERRFHALRAAVGRLVIALDRQRTG